MRLLFITQKLHGQDAFTVLWAEAFLRRGYDVTILCLEWQRDAVVASLGRAPDSALRIVSLGKEQGNTRMGQIVSFIRHITQRRYDRVFIHMTPVWGAVGAPIWIARRTPVYLWYTHYKKQLGLSMLRLYGKRLFCATAQSMPWLEHSKKKIVTGHGIDMEFWKQRENRCMNPRKLLVVHRLSASKRLEIVLRAVALLDDCTLDIYGMDAEPVYAEAMRTLARQILPANRVQFHGSAPLFSLPDIYVQHRYIVNMASETIDKTMLESLTCGCYPIVTPRNAEAIGIPLAPASQSPEAVAAFIHDALTHPPMTPAAMYDLVQRRHSLDALVERMDSFIRTAT